MSYKDSPGLIMDGPLEGRRAIVPLGVREMTYRIALPVEVSDNNTAEMDDIIPEKEFTYYVKQIDYCLYCELWLKK